MTNRSSEPDGVTPAEAEATAISEADVAAYLRQHPDFLVRNVEILGEMLSPDRWGGGQVVDIQKFLVERLRGEVDRLRASTNELISVSRGNLSIQTRTHAAVMAMLSAPSFDRLVRSINEELPLLLDVDMACLCVEPAVPMLPALFNEQIRQLPQGDVERRLGAGHEVFLSSNIDDDGTLFGEGAGLVCSAALARLRPGRQCPAGLLVLGSRAAGTFYPGQGTELLMFLTRVLERALYRWLEPPEDA